MKARQPGFERKDGKCSDDTRWGIKSETDWRDEEELEVVCKVPCHTQALGKIVQLKIIALLWKGCNCSLSYQLVQIDKIVDVKHVDPPIV